LRAEAVENAGKLDRDVAATLDEDARGQLRKMKCLVRRNHMFQPGDVRTMERRGASGDQNGFGAHPRAIGKTHRVRVLEHRAAPDKLNLLALQRANIGSLKPI